MRHAAPRLTSFRSRLPRLPSSKPSVTICIEGPNLSGKSTLTALLTSTLRREGLSVALLTDDEVYRSPELAEFQPGSAYPRVRALLRHSLQERCPSVYIQERGILSHRVFDHPMIAMSMGHGDMPCCIEARDRFDVRIALVPPLNVLVQRAALRPRFVPTVSLSGQHERFTTAALEFSWSAHPAVSQDLAAILLDDIHILLSDGSALVEAIDD